MGAEHLYGRLSGNPRSERDYVTAGALGFIPGISQAKNVSRAATYGRGYLYSLPRTAKGELLELHYAAGYVGARIAKESIPRGARAVAATYGIGKLYDKGKSTLERSLTSSSKSVGTFTPGRSKKFRSKQKIQRKRKSTYCNKHMKYDFCKYYKK